MIHGSWTHFCDKYMPFKCPNSMNTFLWQKSRHHNHSHNFQSHPMWNVPINLEIMGVLIQWKLLSVRIHCEGRFEPKLCHFVIRGLHIVLDNTHPRHSRHQTSQDLDWKSAKNIRSEEKVIPIKIVIWVWAKIVQHTFTATVLKFYAFIAIISSQ